MSRSFLFFSILAISVLFAGQVEQNVQQRQEKRVGEGLAFDLGGGYTWMSISTPPTFSGSTGGVLGKISYQKPWACYGQVKTIYNLGPLSSSQNHARFYEWYIELTGGYCFSLTSRLSLTPYGGVGLDYIHDNQSAYGANAPIQVRYDTYYVVAGLDLHYTWPDWMLGLQADCLPIFDEYLQIKTLSQASWTLKNRVGADVRLPFAYRYVKDFWIELSPYYRYFPIGSSNALGLSHRNLNQWGVFLTFRFFVPSPS